MRSATCTTILALALAATAPLAAQVVPVAPSGSFVGVPIGISTGPNTTLPGQTIPMDEGQLWNTDGGLAGQVPTAPTSTLPVFSKQAMFPNHWADVEIDAMSLGLDLIFGDADGVARIPQQAWGAITFSVTRNTTGQSNSLIRHETQAVDGAAADIFSYVLPGSSIVPNVGIPEKAGDSSHYGLFDAQQPPAVNPDIDSLDVFLPLLDGSPQDKAVMMQLFHGVYFSVTSSSAARLPVSWFRKGNQGVRSGATILYTQWQSGIWSTPQAVTLPQHIGLSANDDLTALAMDFLQEPSHPRILYSSNNPNQDPLMFSYYNGAGGWLTSVYKTLNKDPVSDKVGLRKVDRVDAVCALDPRGTSNLSRAFMPFIIGTAVEDSGESSVQLAVSRDYEHPEPNVTTTKLRLCMSYRGGSDAVYTVSFYRYVNGNKILIGSPQPLINETAEVEYRIPANELNSGKTGLFSCVVHGHLQLLVGRKTAIRL